MLSTTEMVISIAIALTLGGVLAFLFWKQRKEAKVLEEQYEKAKTAPPATQPLQLQAYERLILLVDRIALPNVISRTSTAGLSARDMQLLLTQTIRTEFEYNVTQQIYVSQQSWEAVRNLKDQNIMIVNQISSFLPAEATGQDLSRSILEMLMQSPKASLHNVVADVLSYEAKKLMS
ncbi:hypothetical protein A4D02_33340 [Niastella koreensis]|uniref:Uncharacterized protein n=2 Tax=Niastella koreensis TaxID=354356 RepID=G8TGE8_NIAKG|nr:hypothetical protein [Niastella koreensis]AEV97371.1 hypothetical protein Niako_0992 [Niastella koreensis GR20-10]OQP45543.1 hypothetical protein A4D02_33340 [Niastella koreensis]